MSEYHKEVFLDILEGEGCVTATNPVIVEDLDADISDVILDFESITGLSLSEEFKESLKTCTVVQALSYLVKL